MMHSINTVSDRIVHLLQRFHLLYDLREVVFPLNPVNRVAQSLEVRKVLVNLSKVMSSVYRIHRSLQLFEICYLGFNNVVLVLIVHLINW